MTAIPSNLRVEDRTSLFVQATLHHIEGVTAIKVRNVSPTGALIEGEDLPRSGTPVEMRRGAISAMGTLVWRRKGRAGIEFLTETDVGCWLPHKGAVAGSGKPSYQVFKATPGAAFPTPLPLGTVTAYDIEAAAKKLEELFELLASDAGMQHTYGSKLHALEIGTQMLLKLAAQARNRR